MKPDLAETAEAARRLASLLRMGYPPVEAVGRLRSPAWERVEGEMRAGATLGEAVERCGDEFPPGFAEGLKAGEQAGHPAPALDELGRLLEEARFRQFSLRATLAYPRIVATLLAVVFAILLTAIGPLVKSIYQWSPDEGVSLARLLALLGRAAAHPATLLAGLLALAAFLWLFSAHPASDPWKRRMPVLGSWLLRHDGATWLAWLDLLLAGGVPLARAVPLAAGPCFLSSWRQDMAEVGEEVARGTPLGEALEKRRLLPGLAVFLVRRAEDLGFPPGQLAVASRLLGREGEAAFHRGSELMEPLLILLVGGMLAVMVLLFFLPLYTTIGVLG